MAQGLEELFKHNLWANLYLLDACAKLSADELEASAPGTYGSVRNTLLHLVETEADYVATLTDQPAKPRYQPGAPFPDFESLGQSARQSGKALISYAEQFDSSRILQGVWRGQPYRLRAIIVLMQAINHATEHRAHIMTILSQQGIEPPILDGWGYNDALNRAATTADFQ